ncbi:hypothetical protein BO94DRAFT_528867 [Aspergillus sclerotioniger CBS 115572]|uniref:Uncharacterized protein n=1 Tax=Aspergillus sclerotioniger CBS 115572 TaxID=1450535 RepID=A0A317UZ24_9EURO|nr:hypothetical protein BO94DRAFT_528867 [Aspergillus sclerotioniger CBS 115572]PWY66148.1 hypothetical protein BO94DRAFT_528867 [Aspergillus sclerotioniger CBS 115572]
MTQPPKFQKVEGYPAIDPSHSSSVPSISLTVSFKVDKSGQVVRHSSSLASSSSPIPHDTSIPVIPVHPVQPASQFNHSNLILSSLALYVGSTAAYTSLGSHPLPLRPSCLSLHPHFLFFSHLFGFLDKYC